MSDRVKAMEASVRCIWLKVHVSGLLMVQQAFDAAKSSQQTALKDRETSRKSLTMCGVILTYLARHFPYPQRNSTIELETRQLNVCSKLRSAPMSNNLCRGTDWTLQEHTAV